MSSSVNIGRSNDDLMFRYKMPPLRTKIEGRGNGIKTVIVNMVDVAKALHVTPEYPTKFFGFELGAQSKFEPDTERAIVNGAHSANDLQKLLGRFIDIFVLCPTCKLPEIKMVVEKSKITIDCAACGYNDVLKTAHKLATYIVKNPPATKEKDKDKDIDRMKDDTKKDSTGKSSKKKDDKKDKKKTKKKKKESDSEDEKQSEADEEAAVDHKKGEKTKKSNDKEKDEEKAEVWYTDTSKEAQKARQMAEFAELVKDDSAPKSSNASAGKNESASSLLKAYIASGNRSVNDIVGELRRLQLARGFDDPTRVKNLFQAIFDPSPSTIVNQFKEQAELLKKVAIDKTSSKIVIGCVEDLVGNVNPKLLAYVPHILQTLYDCEVLTEEAILSWAASPPESSWSVSKDFAVSIRNKAKPFIQWLETAEESDDDD